MNETYTSIQKWDWSRILHPQQIMKITIYSVYNMVAKDIGLIFYEDCDTNCYENDEVIPFNISGVDDVYIIFSLRTVWLRWMRGVLQNRSRHRSWVRVEGMRDIFVVWSEVGVLSTFTCYHSALKPFITNQLDWLINPYILKIMLQKSD